MSDITINVDNDEMLGRTIEKALHVELIKKEKEIERLNNIIKEVREYIEEHKTKGYRTPMSDDYEFWNELNENEIKELLEILDKGV